jgi:hypothetical protein
MRDGGEPPIRRVLRPEYREEDCDTHNLTERRKCRKSVGSRGRCEGKKKENSVKI